jgi:iron(III) transport system substrate-binding protein
MRPGTIAARALAALALAACGCDRAPGVTVYASADESVARPVFERFERETGIRVDAKFDTEATKTTGLANLLRAERGRPRADVFWSNEQAANVALAAEGVTRADAGPAPAWPEAWRDASGAWFAFAGRARVIVHRPGLADPPQSWAQLAAPRWKGVIAMADPRFGTTRGHFGAMKAYWDANADPGYFEAFADALAANEPALLTSGNAGVVDAVARGEAEVGLTDTDDVLAAQSRGLQVTMVFPRHASDPGVAGGGTYAIPNTVAIVAGAPHPEQARAFLRFMLSAETERQLASMPARHAPLVTAPLPGDLAIPDPLRVDPSAASAAADGAVARFLRAHRSWPGRAE